MFVRADRALIERSLILLVDVQEKLMPLIHEGERMLRRARLLLDAGRGFGVPILVTEQYPEGLGATLPGLLEGVGAKADRVTKASFSACGWEPFREALLKSGREQVAIAGVEAHICVQQTALDLTAMDYDVFVCADAVGSRRELDWGVSLDRMRAAGVHVTTTESLLFEWCQRCDTEAFRTMLRLIKAADMDLPTGTANPG